MNELLNIEMKTFKQLVTEWDGSYGGHKVGSMVQVNAPGHEDHGKLGRILRQQSINYGVEMNHAPGKLSWHNASKLRKPVPGRKFGRTAPK
jgi:hypothetical protein